jgi:hydrogenase maturation protease
MNLDAERPSSRATLIIGVGNAYRRDDAVGLIVARRLRACGLENVTVREASGEGGALMDAWQDAQTVILVDAAQSGAAAGTLHRFDAQREPIPTQFLHYSTHAFGVAEAIELARALRQLPLRVIVYAIEGQNFGAGDELSPDVARAVEDAVEQIRRDVNSEPKEQKI